MSKDLYNSKRNKVKMYRIETSTRKIEKRLKNFIESLPSIKSKLYMNYRSN